MIIKKQGRKSTKIKTKTEKGITLVALIITIVVLMILAAVAINSITNEGIIGHAGNTADTYNQSLKNEESYLQDYEDMLTAASGGYKDKVFSVGQVVKLIDQTKETGLFYVIEDKTAQGKVVLLAKEYIIMNKTDAKYLTQSSSYDYDDYINFSATKYWPDETGGYYDLIETGVPDASHYAARAAYDYGVKVGGKGRLLTYSEAETLELIDRDIINNSESVLELKGFWLGTSSANNAGVRVAHCGVSDGPCGGETGVGDLWGVRPVVEISKSKVTAVTVE